MMLHIRNPIFADPEKLGLLKTMIDKETENLNSLPQKNKSKGKKHTPMATVTSASEASASQNDDDTTYVPSAQLPGKHLLLISYRQSWDVRPIMNRNN